MPKKSARMKTLLAVYIFVFAGIIFTADNKGTSYLLNFVGNVPYGDKIGHFFLAGFFSFLLNTVFGAKRFFIEKTGFLQGNIIVGALILIEEISQIFIRGRTFDLTDLIADFSGIFVFGKIAEIICRRNKAENSFKNQF